MWDTSGPLAVAPSPNSQFHAVIRPSGSTEVDSKVTGSGAGPLRTDRSASATGAWLSPLEVAVIDVLYVW